MPAAPLSTPPSIALRVVFAGVGSAAAALALAIALRHPLSASAMVGAGLAWAIVIAIKPQSWLLLIPAVLPLANLSPWTGWVVVEELDLFVLATVAAAYLRIALRSGAWPPKLSPLARLAICAFVMTTAGALWRGWHDAMPTSLHLFNGHMDALNGLRVAKSGLFSLLLFPLMRRACFEDESRAFRLFALGMVAGALVALLGLLWERVAFPGLLDLRTPYRTAGLYWEMHVGGATVDAYVVVTTPFVAWALWAARSRAAWGLAALLALLWAYVALTTFARGAYLGLATGLVALGVLLPLDERTARWRSASGAIAYGIGAALLLYLVLDEWGTSTALLALLVLGVAWALVWRRAATRRQRTLGAGLLALALLFEAVLMFGPDGFMSHRSAAAARDAASRTEHWVRGLALLDSPAAWLLGIGLGRLPARYDRDVPGGEVPGNATWQGSAPQAGHARLEGPRSREELAGRHGLTQRVTPHARYTVRLDWRAERPARLLVRVCESHLLYVRSCQWATLRHPGGDGISWRRVEVPLRGPPLSKGPTVWAPRQTVLTLSVLDVGAAIEVDNVELRDADAAPLLGNGDFSRGFAHWLPAAQTYFAPWHIDNLYLELLIERGFVSTMIVLAIAFVGVARCVRAARAGDADAAFIAAALLGLLALGFLSSVLDSPRTALICVLLLMWCALRVK
jgi:hypothetical protein